MARKLPLICLCLAAGAAAFATFGGRGPGIEAAAQTVREAPSGDRAGPFALNYTRVTPQIATAGLLRDGAVPQLKALGFATLVDLRLPAEGTGTEKKAADEAGLRYIAIPVNGTPTEQQVAEFARVVEDPSNAPLLVHCASANRVGAMWALYRARKGIPIAVALEEGRTIGLQPDRETELRKQLERSPR